VLTVTVSPMNGSTPVSVHICKQLVKVTTEHYCYQLIQSLVE